jgi:VWFA-related protein
MPRPRPFFQKREFFNSHEIFRQLFSRNEQWLRLQRQWAYHDHVEWNTPSLGFRRHGCSEFRPDSFRILLLPFLLLVCVLSASGQTTQSHSNPTPSANNPELTSSGNTPAPQDAANDTATFKVNVNLVLVRVVVRDSQHHAIGNLRAENFEIFADGKPQTMRYFAIDHAQSPAASEETSGARSGTELSGTGRQAIGNPEISSQQFVTYVFDDVHLKFADLFNAKAAALRHLTSLPPSDRVAIFSTSGFVTLDFTNDHAKVRAIISKLQPAPTRTGVDEQLPDISGLELGSASGEQSPVPEGCVTRAALAAMLAQQATEQDFHHRAQSRDGVDGLAAVVKRVSIMPGLKTIVVISPDFYIPDIAMDIDRYQSLVDSALRAHVVVNGLDPSGLTPTPLSGCDLNEDCPNGPLAAFVTSVNLPPAVWTPEAMYDLSYTTGGTFFHSNNDLDKGFREMDSIPEFSYVLGFSPVPLKSDGKVHPLRVTLRHAGRFSVQARQGYYAPKNQLAGPEGAKQEIQNEILSREEVHAFPMVFHTQFYRDDSADIHLSVLVHTDVRQMTFQKVAGTNDQHLTLACALFDENGNYVQGIKQDLKMHLLDKTLSKLDSGVTTKADLMVKPGIYFIRVVVRDDEGRISAADDVIDTR